MAKKTEASIQKEIDELKAVINDSSTTPDEKEFAKEEMSGLENQIAKLKEKGEKKPPAQKKAKPAKASKPKKKKEQYKSGDKSLEEMSGDECLEAVKKRRALASKRAGKRKTQSVFSKISDALTGAAEKAIKAVPAADIKAEPEKAVKAMQKVSDIVEKALADIKVAMKPYLEDKDLKVSAAAKKDMDDLDKLVAGIKKKYDK